MKTVEHISEYDFERYSMRTLPELQAKCLEDHLLICDTCLERLQSTASYKAVVAAIMRDEPGN